MELYQRMNSCPSNLNSAAILQAKEDKLTTAFLLYLSGTGTFAKWNIRNSWRGTDPIEVWEALETEEITELSNFAKMLLQIFANQAGCK